MPGIYSIVGITAVAAMLNSQSVDAHAVTAIDRPFSDLPCAPSMSSPVHCQMSSIVHIASAEAICWALPFQINIASLAGTDL